MKTKKYFEGHLKNRLTPGHEAKSLSFIENLRVFASLREAKSCFVKNLFLFVCFAPFAVTLHAQTTLSGDHVITGDLAVGTSGTNGNLAVTGETGNAAAPGVKVTGDGGVLFTGSSGVGQIPVEGVGTRFMWYPKKAALRAGRVEALVEDWDDENIGEGSIALGVDVCASGDYSAAFSAGRAFSTQSTAMSGGRAGGYSSTAMSFGEAWGGTYSTAMSGGIAAGNGSVSMVWSYAEGNDSVAMVQSSAIGYGSVAMGWSEASGGYSVAMSGGSTWGDYSTAMSEGVTEGKFSTAMGQGSYAAAAYSVAMGRYNVAEGNTLNWIETDPLFVIGNGTGDENDPPEVKNRNAVTVYKNGDVTIHKRQGDILMGVFGNPEE